MNIKTPQATKPYINDPSTIFMKYFKLSAILTLSAFLSCNKPNGFDASGNFESDEVIVSAQQNGQLLSFTLNEGDTLATAELVGQIDTTVPKLQMQQALATISSLKQKTSSVHETNDLVAKQLVVQEVELDHQIHERDRTVNLVKADAATQKQLDDINALVLQLQKQISVTKQQQKVNSNNTNTLNSNVMSEKAPLEKTVAVFQDQINKGQVINPVTGVVLSKYAMAGEMATVGRPLYKISNMDTLTLKAYVTGDQLSRIKIGQSVAVRIDSADGGYKNYSGILSTVSSRSEFTPKTIQTKDERANLVYAIKVRVKNDGYLKIGMYGEVSFTSFSK
jgi:HlyD family secretion protein